jgi:hypothetical protein
MQWLAQQTTSEKIHHSRKKKAFLDFISGKPLEPESRFFFHSLVFLLKLSPIMNVEKEKIPNVYLFIQFNIFDQVLHGYPVNHSFNVLVQSHHYYNFSIKSICSQASVLITNHHF